MTLEFSNVLKGVVTQTLLKALLERGGYRVTRLGIEELFAEVKHLDLQQYLRLQLPIQLRSLPDLLVAELDMSHVFLVEAKFRRRFDEAAAQSISAELKQQQEHWPQSYAVIMISEPFVSEGKFHQDYIRVLRPGEMHKLTGAQLTPAERWEGLSHLQRVFTHFNNEKYIYDVQKAADTLTQTLQDLSKI
jgi:hypothetical protein